jgi:hypothetical protein
MASVLDTSDINNWSYNQWLIFESTIQNTSKFVINLHDQAKKSKLKDIEWDVAEKKADSWWSDTISNNKQAVDAIMCWNNKWKFMYITKKEWIKIAIWAIIKDNNRFYNPSHYKLGNEIINIFQKL